MIIKSAFYFVLLTAVLSCGEMETDKKENITAKSESKYTKLLSKFKSKSFDTLRVYSPEELDGEYRGVELDSADAVLFPKDIADQHFNDPGLFAVYQFPIDDNRLGLIARTPSMYVPSSLKLFFFDKAKDSITSYVELAETWGDAGDYMQKDSWLFKDNGKQIKSFVWLMEGHDNSVENENDTTTEEWNNYYLLDLSKGNADTISKNSEDLKRIFSSLIKNN